MMGVGVWYMLRMKQHRSHLSNYTQMVCRHVLAHKEYLRADLKTLIFSDPMVSRDDRLLTSRQDDKSIEVK